MACKNIELIKSLLDKYMNGDGQGYIDGCSDDFKGQIFSGLIPGGNSINGKEELQELFKKMPEYIEVIKFEPKDWSAIRNIVYFTVDWEFKWVPTGKIVKTSANVKKVIKDGKISEKYHIVNYGDIID